MSTGGPAFPGTLLDWMAGQALAGSLASQSKESHWAFAPIEYETADDRATMGIAALCYAIASAMLAEKARREAVVKESSTPDHSGETNKMVEDHFRDATKKIAALEARNLELVDALELLVCGAEKVQKKGYAFALLSRGVVTARAALAKAKEDKP